MVNCSESGAGLPVSPARQQALPDEVTFFILWVVSIFVIFFSALQLNKGR